MASLRSMYAFLGAALTADGRGSSLSMLLFLVDVASAFISVSMRGYEGYELRSPTSPDGEESMVV